MHEMTASLKTGADWLEEFEAAPAGAMEARMLSGFTGNGRVSPESSQDLIFSIDRKSFVV